MGVDLVIHPRSAADQRRASLRFACTPHALLSWRQTQRMAHLLGCAKAPPHKRAQRALLLLRSHAATTSATSPFRLRCAPLIRRARQLRSICMEVIT